MGKALIYTPLKKGMVLQIWKVALKNLTELSLYLVQIKELKLVLHLNPNARDNVQRNY